MPGPTIERFFAELRRRNVVRVAVAYLAFSWLAVQAIGEIGPILGLPDWVSRLVLLVLALGFAVSLVLAWVYDLTTKGIRTTAEVDADATLKRVKPHFLNYVIIGTLTLALGYFVWESRFAGDEKQSEPRSIAVLPFRDLSARGDQQYFADGVAEELINTLSRIPGMRVTGRTSAFALRGSEERPQEVGETLGVTHLLEGSVRSDGERLRVTARLVKVEDGFQVWSHEFEGDLSDVFEVQDELSGMVAEGLKLHLQADPGESLPQVPVTANLNAYNDYLLGRYQLARRTADSLPLAQSLFSAATRSDPGYAPAWAALATTLVVSPYYLPVESPSQLAASARQAAMRAIDIDPETAEAWSALGTLQMIFERDWEAARNSLERAVALLPNDAGTANLYGDYLYNVGDYVGALEYELRAAALDPLTAANQHEVAVVYELLGRVDEAMAQERLAIEIDPEFRNAWSTLGRYYLQTGRLGELRELLDQQQEVLGNRYTTWLQARLLMAEGNTDAARELTDRALVDSRTQSQPLTPVARLYAELGDDGQAAELVREAYAAGDAILVSPLYFFLPEDWPQLPQLQAALDQPELNALYELRRHNIAAGRGRVLAAPGR